MGKYTDQLNNLRERRRFMQSNHRRLMDAYGGIMDEKYRCLNESHYEIALSSIDRDIARAERLVDKERIDEITAGVLANLSKEGGKAMRDIAGEFQKAMKNIKL